MRGGPLLSSLTSLPPNLQIGVDTVDGPLLLACAQKATLLGESAHKEPFEVDQGRGGSG
jgi:hypothetical protein